MKYHKIQCIEAFHANLVLPVSFAAFPIFFCGHFSVTVLCVLCVLCVWILCSVCVCVDVCVDLLCVLCVVCVVFVFGACIGILCMARVCGCSI